MDLAYKKKLTDILIETTIIKDVVGIVIDYISIIQGKCIGHFEGGPRKNIGGVNRMATDGECIYVCRDSKIGVFDSNGIAQYRSNCHTNGPSGFLNDICCYDHMLFVLSYHEISIFRTPSLELIRSFTCESFCWRIHVYGSNIYVSRKNSIIIYSLEGKHINRINLITVKWIGGISVYNNYIYTCGHLNDLILQVPIEGGVQTEFNDIGKLISKPKQIVMENDFIYVCSGIWIYQITGSGLIIGRWRTSYTHTSFVILNGKCYVSDISSKISIFI